MKNAMNRGKILTAITLVISIGEAEKPLDVTKRGTPCCKNGR